MNPVYYDTTNKLKVVESMYYPESKEIASVPVEYIEAETNIQELLNNDDNTNKKEVKFIEENIFETKPPVFSAYSYDQNHADPNFFKKKIQSFYHESMPEEEVECNMENEATPQTYGDEKEILIKDFIKAKDHYMRALEKMRLAGVDEEMINIFTDVNDVETTSLPKFTSSTCDVSAKESTYVGMTDM